MIAGQALDVADRQDQDITERLSHEEVFASLRELVNGV